MGISYQLVFYSEEKMEKVLQDFLNFACSNAPITTRKISESEIYFDSFILDVPIVAFKYKSESDSRTAISHNIAIHFIKLNIEQLEKIMEICVKFLKHYDLAGIFQDDVSFEDDLMFAYNDHRIMSENEVIPLFLEGLVHKLDLEYSHITF